MYDLKVHVDLLPPTRVVSFCEHGERPERTVWTRVVKWIGDYDLPGDPY